MLFRSEIRAGTGGLEASLFASDLFKMYEKVSQKKKWSLELISISRSDAVGGLTLGADPLVCSVAMKSWTKKRELNALIVRKEAIVRWRQDLIEEYVEKGSL